MNALNCFLKHDAYIFRCSSRVKVKKRRELFLTLKELALIGYWSCNRKFETVSKLTATEVFVQILSLGFVIVRKNLSELDVYRLQRDTSLKIFSVSFSEGVCFLTV